MFYRISLCISNIWEFLFCSDPLRAPLLTRGRNGSQRDVAYVLPIHGQNVPELAGGRHVGGIENCDFSIGSWDGGWWKWCETPMKWLYPRKNVDFSSRKIDKKWKMAWNGSSEELFELRLSRFSVIFWDKSIGNSPIRPNLVKKSILKGSAGQKKSFFLGGADTK